MKKLQKFLAIIFICMLPLMLSCGGGDGGGEAPPPAVDVTGTWSGTWASSNEIDHGNLAATLTQSGTSVSGTVSITESCMSSGSVSGNVSGNNVGFGVVSGTDTITYTSTGTSTSMSGTYSVTAGECAGDTGTFSMTKQVHSVYCNPGCTSMSWDITGETGSVTTSQSCTYQYGSLGQLVSQNCSGTTTYGDSGNTYHFTADYYWSSCTMSVVVDGVGSCS